jgi:bacteriocin-like protein
MKTITTTELSNVTGGKATDAVTQQLTALQGSIKDLASAQTNKPASGLDPTMLMMMMAMRPQQSAPTVVAGAPAAAPVVNISTRVRRW